MLHPLLAELTQNYPTPRLVACSALGFTKKHVSIANKYNIIGYELRLDLLYEKYPEHIEKVVHKNLKILQNKNIIFTIRSSKEGGSFKEGKKKKQELYFNYLSDAFALDIEIRELPQMKNIIKEAKAQNKIIIASYHNFSTVPSLKFLQGLVRKGTALGADVIKIAVFTDDPLQLVPLMVLQKQEKSVALSLMTMGKTALLSRTIFALEGSIWTYASSGKPTAPYQPTCKQIFTFAQKYFKQS